MIPKKAPEFPKHLSSAAFFESARAGLSAFYRSRAVNGRLRVILPSYIGWSPNEGSGLFDSVTNANYEHAFYKLNRQGDVSVDSLRAIEETDTPSVLVLVHYFGRPDPHYDELVSIGKDRGWALAEDCAHSMLTHLCTQRLGTRSDAMVYSLHKMLPLNTGGVLLTTAGGIPDGLNDECMVNAARSFVGYDYATAANHRQKISIEINNNMSILHGLASPLWGNTDLTKFVPQSYPIVINAGPEKRNLLYERLHEQCGLTTLYHTLIKPLLENDAFEDSQWLSNHITNLPVHTAVSVESVKPMLIAIQETLSE